MRTRVTEYKVTVASNMAVVHVKKPSGITLASGTASPEVYRITVSDVNWESDKTFLWDKEEGAWYEEGVTPVVYYEGTAPDVIISNGTTGASIVNPNNNLAYGTITAIEHIEAVAGGYTDAAKRIITEAIRLIYDETQKVLLCSTAKKANIYGIEPSTETGYDVAVVFNLTALAAEATAAGKAAKATAIGNIAATDQFTIAMDWGVSAEDILKAVSEVSVPAAMSAAVAQAVSDIDDATDDAASDIEAAATGASGTIGTAATNAAASISNALSQYLEEKDISIQQTIGFTDIINACEEIAEAVWPEMANYPTPYTAADFDASGNLIE